MPKLTDIDAQKTGAPYEAQFHPDGESQMFAHTLAEMMAHVGNAVARKDKRFRGFVRVTNHRRDLVFCEVNVLGWIAETSPTQRFSERLAAGVMDQ